MSYEWVKRPPHGATLYDYAAIIGTAGTDQAVKIPLGPRSWHTIQSALQRGLKTRGYKSHTRYDRGDKFLTAWCEPLPGQERA